MRFGAVAPDCALKPGAIWVHVTDDRGIDVPRVPTAKAADKASTNDDGTAIYNDVDPGPHTVALEPLTHDLLVDFEEFSGVRERPVTVAPGQIAYVPYQLARKPALKVRVEKPKQRTPKKLFGGATVSTEGAATLQETTDGESGVADFQRVKAGDYAVKVALDSKDEAHFATRIDFTKESAPVNLAQGQERLLVVEVEEINVVAGKATIDKDTLFIDDDPNDDDSVGVVTLSLVQTNADQKYMKEMWLKCVGPADVEASLTKDPWDSLAGSLKSGIKLEAKERDALRDGQTVSVHVRGKATAGDLQITLELEDPASRFVKLGDAQQPATAKIEIVARPHVKIAWMDTGAGVQDVDVSFAARGDTYGFKSKDTGFARWDKRGITPGSYEAAFAFSDNIKYLLHTETGDPVVGTPTVDLQHKAQHVTFKIRKGKVTIGAVCATGGKPAEEIGGKITVKLNPTPVTLTKGGGPKPVEVPIVEVDQRCLIETFEPDVADVYELVTVEQK